MMEKIKNKILNNSEKIVLLLILFLAFFLRFYKLTSIPAGLARDEASIGYTAYSILKTGRDEYGNLLPLSIKSFGDFKLPLYVYLEIPFIALFGLSEFAVRAPSALFGSLTVFVIYFLVKELFVTRRKTQNFTQNNAEFLPLLSSLLLAISPWHIYFSRPAFEANIALFMAVLALYLFIKRKLVWSSFLFGLTLFTYHGYQIFTPLFILGLAFWLRRRREKLANTLLFIGIFLSVATVAHAVSFKGNIVKFQGTNFLNRDILYGRVERWRNEHQGEKDSNLARIFHNKATAFTSQFLINYFQSFSPRFLFDKSGETPGHSIEGRGNIYLIDGFLIVLGASFLLWRREKNLFPIILWLLLVLLPSVLTKDHPSSVRLLSLTFPFAVLGGAGLIFFKRNKLVFIGVMLFLLMEFIIFLEAYFCHYPINKAQIWYYGYKQVVELSRDKYPQAQKVIMAGMDNSPYIYFLFHLKYDPAKYQKEAIREGPTWDKYYPVRGFNRFEFTRTINWTEAEKTKGTFFVDFYGNIPSEINLRGKINLPSGEPYIGYYYLD